MTLKIYRWLSILLLAIMGGCYPEGAEYTDELDLVYTNYSPTFDFKTKKTFAMPDSVVKITGDNASDPDGNGKPEFSKSSYSAAILTSLKQQMQANGWQLVGKNDNPDVLLLPSTMTTTNIYYYYDWWYWGWWYGGWYGWYYPGWYYPPYVTGYRSGSVFIQMIDRPKATPVADNVAVVWHMILNGLAEGDQTNISARIQSSIEQGFQQSPYLKIN
jgi:hypothetical protein